MNDEMDPRNLGDRVEAFEALDHLARPAHRAVAAALPRGPLKDLLHGVWLGHPLHPLMTDLPIGFWTSAFVLDLVGGRKAQRAADALVGLGVVTALPTAAAGLADWSELNEPERRTGLVHAVSNILATALYGWSYIARRRGRRVRGVMFGLAGATAATAGGYLGGHLTFRRAAGVNAAASAPTTVDWTDVSVESTLSKERPTLAHLDGEPLAAFDADGGPTALFARCSHVGGPLDEGDLVDGCVRCPWHGSEFRIADGRVERGPATATQPAYELRRDGERVQARRRPPP
jgi:nitrite reductase/ring-hydroxylating ferredoxin subunit/uncharacterized membrane protein